MIADPQSGVRVGYGKEFADYEHGEIFHVQLPPLNRRPADPFAEAVACARDLSRAAGGQPLNLGLSGGLDSEVMALAFRESGVPFRAWTLRFKKDLNSDDIRPAAALCCRLGIEHRFVDLDIVDFYERERYWDYVRSDHCLSPEVAAQLWFLDQIDGPVVWGGEAFRALDDEAGVRLQHLSEVEGVFFRYFRRRNRIGTPNFHFHSTPLSWAFLKTSVRLRHRVCADDHDPRFYAEKLQFYRAAGFAVEETSLRNRKLHGFEQVKVYFDLKLKAQNADYRLRYRYPVAQECPMTRKCVLILAAQDPVREGFISL